MARTGRAAVYDAPNTPFVIRSYPLRAVRPGEVLVRVTMSTICRSDIHSWQGRRPNPCPGILGHEIVGVIEELGSAVGSDLRGSDVLWSDFRGASLAGADLSELSNARRARFAGATYDDFTQLHPDIDTSEMIYLPEPGTLAGLVSGTALLSLCARRRGRLLAA